MSISLGELAKLVGGELTGEPDVPIHDAAILRDVVQGQITLADGPKLEDELAACEASAVVVPRGFHPEGIPTIEVDDLHAAFAKIVSCFRPKLAVKQCGISAGAQISPTATIAQGVVIHAGVTIGDHASVESGTVIHPGVHIFAGCKIGKQVTIFPNVVLYENTVVGDRTVLHANCVLGAFGFGYDTVEGQHALSAQLGYVVIGNDVEIGACTTIDRGTYGPTSIGDGTKIDNQVMIAHNCRIGRHNLICSQVGIAGSCSTGDYVVMAGQVGLRDHIDIGDRVILGAKSGVMDSIPEGSVYLGIPATPEREQLVKHAALAKLPAMRKEFKDVKKRLEALEVSERRDAA